jgi:hypothetical protein
MSQPESMTDLEVSPTEQTFIEHQSLAYKTWLGELDISIPA